MKKYVLVFILSITYLNLIFAGEWEIETNKWGVEGNYVYTKNTCLSGTLLKNNTSCRIQIYDFLCEASEFYIEFPINNIKVKSVLEKEFGEDCVVTFRNNSITKSFCAYTMNLSNYARIRVGINFNIEDTLERLNSYFDLFKMLKEYNDDVWKISIKGEGWNLETQIDKIPIIRDKNYPLLISDYGKSFYGVRIWESRDLTSLIIPNGITEIKGNNNCCNIELITIPNTIKKTFVLFGLSGFYKLKRVILSDSLEEICPDLFYGCRSLEAIEIPKSVKIINDSAFTNCESLKSINIRSVETITKGAFDGCKSLKTLETDSKFWHIENGFLMGGDSIVSVLDLHLEKYTLPKNIQKEDFELFIHSCNSTIKELVISSPTKIENIDFSDEICSNRLKNLKKISVPKSVKLSHFPTTVQIIRK